MCVARNMSIINPIAHATTKRKAIERDCRNDAARLSGKTLCERAMIASMIGQSLKVEETAHP
jgi:hypothetical protein